jgi:hypothetical protein
MENFIKIEPTIEQIIKNSMHQDSEISKSYVDLCINLNCTRHIEKLLRDIHNDLGWRHTEILKNKVQECIDRFFLNK